MNYTKFLGLTIQYDGHIEEIIEKLSTACYMIRNIKPVVYENIKKVFIIHISNLL
jgi:hypothetical protein